MEFERTRQEGTGDTTSAKKLRLNFGGRATVTPDLRAMAFQSRTPMLQLSSRSSQLVPAPKILQAKLTVNEPGDQYEQEADRVAEQVMRMPLTSTRLQRQCGCGGASSSGGSCQECESRPSLIQRRAASTADSGTQAPNIVDEMLRSSGQPLDHSTRDFMESRFGYDFSHVRVHADARAAESARSVNALAYTVGRDIVFGAGRYAPADATSRHLISHELTHVIQQSHAPQVALPVRGGNSGVQGQQAGPMSSEIGAGPRVGAASQASERRLARFSDTGHHVIEEAALTGAGFSPQQIQAIERGNIQRDYSQIGRVGNFILLCRPEKFGGYDAAEHFDNFIFDAVTNRWRSRGVGRQFRYADPNATDPTPFDYIESQLMALARTGMSEDSLVHLGNAFHTVEDFFTHSNFVELINHEVRGDQTLLTGSVPGTEGASVAHVVADVSGPPMREYYQQQAAAATARTEPDSHARMAHDTPDSHNYAQARRLAALVVQNLGVDVRAALQQPQPDQRRQLMYDTVMTKIRRFLRPPSQDDRWWEQLVEQDAGVMDRRLEEVAGRTPVTVNQCVFNPLNPLRNLEASSSSSWRMPIGVALPVQVGGTQIWLQVGGGVQTAFPLDRSVREPPAREDDRGGFIAGGQITGRF